MENVPGSIRWLQVLEEGGKEAIRVEAALDDAMSWSAATDGITNDGNDTFT